MLRCRDVLEQADAYLIDERQSGKELALSAFGLCRNCRRYLR